MLLTICIQVLGLIFGGEKEVIWTSVLDDNCSRSCEIEVKLLNCPNWTSIAQVVVHLISRIVIA